MMPRIPQRQSGAVLVVGLLLLLVLTLLGVTAMQASTMQERLAGNSRDLNTAFQAAEAAIRAGERRLRAASLPGPGSGGWYHHSLAPAPSWRNPTHWNGSYHTMELQGVDEEWSLASAPRFAIEQLPPVARPSDALEAGAVVPDEDMYRVTARASGGSAGTVVILQTTYRR
jgi:type IV pilus assembly protein PilX